MIVSLIFLTGSFALLALALWAAFPLPSLDGRRASTALDGRDTPIAAAIAPVAARHPGHGAVRLPA